MFYYPIPIAVRHTSRVAVALVAAVLICGGIAASSACAEMVEIAPAERLRINTKLRSKVETTRLEAIERLAQSPSVDSLRLLIDAGLADSAETVQLAACRAVVQFVEQPELREALQQRLLRESQAAQPNPVAVTLLRVALQTLSANEPIPNDDWFNTKFVITRHAAPLAIMLADQLASRAERTDVPTLVNLLRTKLAESFPVRRAAVQTLTRIEAVEAIEALIAELPRFSGETLLDAVEYLQLVTQQRLTDSAHWSQWWQANKATFEFPWPLVRPRGRTILNTPVAAGESTYYGMPIYAKRVVFVLDGSGSMSGVKLAKAQDELAQAIVRLPADVHFGIVVFNSDVLRWRPALVPAERGNKDAALQFVRRIVAQNNTSTFPALQTALGYDAEAAYLLTDGVPSSGRIVAPPAIVATITQQNRLHRQSIYTIGVGADIAGPEFATFLRTLAESNRGAYRSVEP
ncbi:MAG: VWA domain-containing protein [Planctomycetaceae bacterium]|nr:VWA domain-containing protein [Planctomycetaceae bacterium]